MRRITALLLSWLFAGQPALAATCVVDGAGNNNNAATVSLTTASANDVVLLTYVSNLTAGPPSSISSIGGAGLTWTKRWATNASIASCFSGSPCYVDTELWWAYAPTPLTAAVFTITGTHIGGNYTAVFALANTANPSAPFDPNGAIPAFNSTYNGQAGSYTTMHVTPVSTSNGNDLIIYLCGLYLASVVSSGVCNNPESSPPSPWSIPTGTSQSFFNAFTGYGIASQTFLQRVSSTFAGAVIPVPSTMAQTSPTWANGVDAIQCVGLPLPGIQAPFVWIHE